MQTDHKSYNNEITSKLWQILDLFKGEMDVSEYKGMVCSILFLKFIEESRQDESLKNTIHDIIILRKHNQVANVGDKLNQIFYELERANSRLKNIFSCFDFNKYSQSGNFYYKLTEALSIISTFDFKNRNENFAFTFDTAIDLFSGLEGKKSGESIQPIEISTLMSYFIPKISRPTVYNPFAGYASLALQLPEDASYSGQELYQNTWAIGKMRLIAHGVDHRADLSHEDSISNWRSQITHVGSDLKVTVEKISYDFIVGTPPFNLKLNHARSYNNLDSKQTLADTFFIEQAAQTLSESGSAAILTTHGSLFKGGVEKQLRESLIEQDLIEYIIGLPAGLFSNTSLPSVLIVLNKIKKDIGQVHFIDARSLVTSKSSRDRKLEIKSLLLLIEQKKYNNIHRLVENREIINQDYNLNIGRYFLPEISVELGISLVKIGNLIQINSGQRSNNDQVGKVVRMGDLKDDSLDYIIDVNSLSDSKLTRTAQKITKDCLFLSRNQNSFKPTFFKYNGTPVFIYPEMLFALKVDTTRVDISYLVNELSSTYVTEQLTALQSGSVMPILKREDLLDIKIKLPDYYNQAKYIESLKEQRAKALGVKETLLASKQKEIEYLQKIHGIESSIQDQNSFLRHSISGPMGNLSFYFSDLQQLILNSIESGNQLVMDSCISPGEDSLNEILRIIGENIKEVRKEIAVSSKTEDDMENIKLEEINLIEEANDFSKTNQLPNTSILFDFDQDLLKDIKDDVKIMASPNLLRKLLFNLLTNADKHAFKETDKNVFEIYVTNDMVANLVILKVSNTGLPFPDGFDKPKYVRKGSKAGPNSGEGYGGYLINEIVEKLHGEFDFISDIKDGPFTTEFTFKFPIVKN